MPGEPLGGDTTNPSTGSTAGGLGVDEFSYDSTTLRCSDGTLYEGPLVAGEPEGHGVCVFPSGTVCVGNFARGLLEGPAEVLQPSGALFSGVFRRSVAHGRGVCLLGDRLTRGKWKNGEMVEEVRAESGDGDRGRILASVARVLRGHLRVLLCDGTTSQPMNVAGATRINEPLVHFGRNQLMGPNSSFASEERNEYQTGVTSGNAPTRSPSYTRVLNSGNVQQNQPMDLEGSFSYSPGKRRQSAADGHQQEKSVPKSILATGASPEAIFSSAAPAANEMFSLTQYAKYCAFFLFPFLSLPQLPFSPIRSAMLDMEREFVVSGAPLLREFDPPVVSLYLTTLAMCCQIAATAIVAMKVNLGNASEGRMTLAEMSVPCVLWVTHAGLLAGYNSYLRVAHALERLDRRLTPRLSAFAAGLVDAKTNVCIYTWDDEGRGMVTDSNYRYRWVMVSLFVGIIMGIAAPLTRLGFGNSLFGSDVYERSAAILVLSSEILFSSTLAYYVVKMTDMQRQMLEQMRVLTRLAYLEDRSMMRPSEFLKHRFNFEEPLNLNDVFSGVVGWYVVRSLVLYAATCSNHAARSTAMSIFFLMVLCGFLVTIGDIVYMLVAGHVHNGTYFSTGHTYAIVLCTAWAILLLRYLYVCVRTVSERGRHLYLLDVASLYHRLKQKEGDFSGDTIATCRRMLEAYDQLPCIFSTSVTPLMLTVVHFIHLVALVAVFVDLYIAVSYR
ncbi:hypothetical protein DQ04_04741030 [Trypanosoma grayi]|uniref:hypothetical protein n=1 Tax=Trypanosoma grayi TaxID=71804 RepID=UPI0004F42C7D|nr:hypothetical protein DQ04_04741030 [Trypanosoma grayi]KEG09732.1 hypothetical protein DQ04_04741030 [Trypanosoma grayi]